MSDGTAARGSAGVTVETLAVVELGPEIEGMAGRRLRMRMVTMQPGATFGPTHDHIDRPGVGWPEDRQTRHWLENRGSTPAVEISVDIVRIDVSPA